MYRNKLSTKNGIFYTFHIVLGTRIHVHFLAVDAFNGPSLMRFMAGHHHPMENIDGDHQYRRHNFAWEVGTRSVTQSSHGVNEEFVDRHGNTDGL